MYPSYKDHQSPVNLDKSDLITSSSCKSMCANARGTAHPRERSGGKTRITCPPQVVNCLDFLKINFWIDWDSQALFNQLENIKQLAQEMDQNWVPFRTVGGLRFNVYRTGTSQYSFRLKTGDVTLLLNKRKSTGPVPTARLEVGSLSCWTPGFTYTYEKLKKWINALGGTFKKELISEIHLAADFINTDINSLNIENEDKWVSRVQKFSIHRDRRRLSGITLGKGDLMLRVYDKVLELEKSPNKQEPFAEIWKVSSFNQVPVTRVEFQIRRNVLREFEGKINNFKDLLFSLQSLWEYCTGSWSRFCADSVNRNHNQSKSNNSQFWETVSKVGWSGVHSIKRSTIAMNKNIENVWANLRGNALSIGAYHNVHPEDLDAVIGITTERLAKELTKLYENDPHEFAQRIKRKHNEIYVNI